MIAEITTHQLRRDSVAAVSDTALESDVDALVEKVRQVDATLERIRADESALTRRQPTPGRRFHPVVIVTEGFPVNPIVLQKLRTRMEDEQLLAGGDTTPVEIVTIVEMEMVEALHEIGGPSLQELLSAKQYAGLAKMSLRDYILVDRRLQPPRPRRLEELWQHHSSSRRKRSVLAPTPIRNSSSASRAASWSHDECLGRGDRDAELRCDVADQRTEPSFAAFATGRREQGAAGRSSGGSSQTVGRPLTRVDVTATTGCTSTRCADAPCGVRSPR